MREFYWNEGKYPWSFFSWPDSLPATCVPIVGIRCGIASPSLMETFCFRVSHRVTPQRGRASFRSCRWRFRTGDFRIVARHPPEPLRQEWILESRNNLYCYFPVSRPTNSRGTFGSTPTLSKVCKSTVHIGDKNANSLQTLDLPHDCQCARLRKNRVLKNREIDICSTVNLNARIWGSFNL